MQRIPRTPTAVPTRPSRGTAPPAAGTPPRRRSSPPAGPPAAVARAGARPRRQAARPAAPTSRAPPHEESWRRGGAARPSRPTARIPAIRGATAAHARASRTRHDIALVSRSTVHVRRANPSADVSQSDHARRRGGSTPEVAAIIWFRRSRDRATLHPNPRRATAIATACSVQASSSGSCDRWNHGRTDRRAITPSATAAVAASCPAANHAGEASSSAIASQSSASQPARSAIGPCWPACATPHASSGTSAREVSSIAAEAGAARGPYWFATALPECASTPDPTLVLRPSSCIS